MPETELSDAAKVPEFPAQVTVHEFVSASQQTRVVPELLQTVWAFARPLPKVKSHAATAKIATAHLVQDMEIEEYAHIPSPQSCNNPRVHGK